MLDFFLDLNSTDMRILGSAAGDKTQTSAQGSDKVAEIFTAIKTKINPELVSTTNSVYQFVVTGKKQQL